MNVLMGEQQYLDLLQKILDTGMSKDDRTGTGTLSLFGEKMEFDISERIPILTTKRVFWKSVLKELLWFVSGSTDVKVLQDQGVKFWNENTSREFLDKRGLTHLRENDLGEGYGFLWRHFGATYVGCDHNYRKQIFMRNMSEKFVSKGWMSLRGTNIEIKEDRWKGVDQLSNVIDLLHMDPFSRRIIISAWNPGGVDRAALPPCHCFVQFYCVELEGVKYLDCCLYQRSGDMFLGVPFNIASYSFLTYMIAHVVGMKPRKFIHMIGDSHIYKNHIDVVKEQLGRNTREFPTLRFTRDIIDIDDFRVDDFVVEGYDPYPYIGGKMAV